MVERASLTASHIERPRMTPLRKDGSIWSMIAGLTERLDSHELDVLDH